VGPDTIVSYITTHEYAARQEATGRREACIARVGTLPAHRRRGLARWLLRHGLAAYRTAGYDEALLGVDSENPTGALRLYEQAGFVAERQFTQYLLQLP
jgi:ribosomal protein S18 acetylase RimI-like enzyme